ncbi:hypothetical protein AX23_02970 [Brucella melitensis 548]|nr:hypothetical protein AX23_02970 [Brucella melitensis 548]
MIFIYTKVDIYLIKLKFNAVILHIYLIFKLNIKYWVRIDIKKAPQSGAFS